MPFARPRIAPRRFAGLVLALLATVSLLAALLVEAKPCLSFTLAAHGPSSPAARSRSRSRLVEAVPRRVVHEARRDGRSFDDVTEPVLLTALGAFRAPVTFARLRGAPARRVSPRGAIAHFRRRIPRMNADEPPSV